MRTESGAERRGLKVAVMRDQAGQLLAAGFVQSQRKMIAGLKDGLGPDADKMIIIDFMSWDPLPWTESWDITAYGTEDVMHSRPLPASYKIYNSGRNGQPEGWPFLSCLNRQISSDAPARARPPRRPASPEQGPRRLRPCTT